MMINYVIHHYSKENKNKYCYLKNRKDTAIFSAAAVSKCLLSVFWSLRLSLFINILHSLGKFWVIAFQIIMYIIY